MVAEQTAVLNHPVDLDDADRKKCAHYAQIFLGDESRNRLWNAIQMDPQPWGSDHSRSASHEATRIPEHHASEF